MNRFEKYPPCKFCEKISEIKMYHRNMKFLTYLLEECGSDVYSSNLFNIIRHHLLLISNKYKLLRGPEQNKIVSKYYIYFIKHRNFINFDDCVLPYSPLKKEEVAKEFQNHLDGAIKIYNNCL